MLNEQIVFIDNEPGEDDPTLISPLERISNNNANNENRSYKLLGVYLMKTLVLTPTSHTFVKSYQDQFSVSTKSKMPYLNQP